MQYRYINTERDNSVTIITINRPERMNALNAETRSELINAIDRADQDESVRVVIITGSGNSFSAGADLNDAPDEITQKILRSDLKDSFHIIARKIRNSRKIFISAIDGITAGAGISLAFICDLVYASPRSRFILAFQGIGLAPDTGLSYIITRRSGGRFSRHLLLGGEFSAECAEKAGLLELAEDPLSEARNTANIISHGPFAAYSTGKILINRSLYFDFEEFLELEAEEQSKLASTHDFVEGVAAFRDKRRPVFMGK
ncbi:enoyl-CoA hydratase-related protein [Thermoplasma sp.]|uniref:enoyl-CoA hydratase-related protein n=1 Tax=Thermoplasma sp. TaxID=1973142 RepID=UPI00261CFFEA|nr:enoyl-CoA hydratase-related protein [Thermoplasma sp.]